MNSVETLADVPAIVEPRRAVVAGPGRRRLDRPEVLRRLRARRAARASTACRWAPPSAPCWTWPAAWPAAPRSPRCSPGGASSNFLGPDRLDVRLDFDTLAEAGLHARVRRHGGDGRGHRPARRRDQHAARSSATSRAASACPAGSGPTKAHALLDRVAGRGRGWTSGGEARGARAGDGAAHGRRSAASARWRWARWPASSGRRGGAADAPSRGTRTRRPCRGTSSSRRRPSSEALRGFRPGRGARRSRRLPLARRAGPGPRRGRSPHRPRCPGSRGRPSTASRSGRPTRSAPRRACPATSTSSVRSRWAGPADVAVRPGTAVAMPTGGVLPHGADAVVMVEHTQVAMPGTVEVVRPGRTRRRDGARRRGRGRRCRLAPAGRPLRAQDLGLLAAAGVVEVRVHAPARGGASSPPATRSCRPATGDADAGPGAGRDGRRRWRRWSPAAAASRCRWASSRTTPAALDRALRGGRCPPATWSSSAPGRRSAPGTRRPASSRASGAPGIFCHGLAIRPGKPTVLAECDGVPVIGLPGNPLSALVVFRLVGLPVLRLVGGCLERPARAGHAGAAGPRGAVGRRAPRRRAGPPVPRGGRAGVRALGAAVGAGLGGRLRGRARGRHRARRRVRGRRDAVWLAPTRGRTARSSGTSPPTEALAAWRRRLRRRRVPRARSRGHASALADAVGRVTAEAIWARRSSPAFDAAAMDGIAVRSTATVGASETTPLQLTPEDYDVVDTGDPMPPGRDAVVMREQVHPVPAVAGLLAELRTAVAAVPARPLHRRGHGGRRAAAARGPPAARRRRGGGRRGRRHLPARPTGAPRGGRADRRRGPAARVRPAARARSRTPTR